MTIKQVKFAYAASPLLSFNTNIELGKLLPIEEIKRETIVPGDWKVKGFVTEAGIDISLWFEELYYNEEKICSLFVANDDYFGGVLVTESIYTCKIKEFYLEPFYRKKGISSKWYNNYIEPYLISCGFRTVYIEGSCLTEESVLNFWKKKGFKQIGWDVQFGVKIGLSQQIDIVRFKLIKKLKLSVDNNASAASPVTVGGPLAGVESKERKRLTIFYTAIFLSTAGVGMIVSIISLHIKSLVGVGASLSIILGMYHLSAFLSGVTMGRMSDLYGRKLLISLGMLGCILSGIGLFFSQGVFFLTIFYTLQAVALSIFMPSSVAYLNSFSLKKREGKYLGYFESIYLFASGLGIFVGGFFADIVSQRSVFLAMSFLNILAFFIMQYLPETKAKVSNNKSTFSFRAFKEPSIIPMLIIGFSLGVSNIIFKYFGPFLFMSLKNSNSTKVGILIGVGTLANILSKPFIGKRLDHYDKNKVFIALLALDAALLFVIPHVAGFFNFFILALAFGITGSALYLISKLYILIWVNDNKQSENMGVYQGGLSSAENLGKLLGVIIGGITAFNLNYPFYFAGLIKVVGLLGFIKFLTISDKESEAVSKPDELTKQSENDSAASPVMVSGLAYERVNGLDRFLSFMMGKMNRMLFREPLVNPIADKGKIPQPFMRGNFPQGLNLRDIQAQRNELLFRPDKFYFGRFKLFFKIGNAMSIPEFSFFFQRFKLWYARFHNLSPPIEFAFGFRHRPRRNYFSLVLSKIFKYYRKIPSASRMSQRGIPIISCFQDKRLTFKTSFFNFSRFDPVPSDMRYGIVVPFDKVYLQVLAPNTNILRNTIDVKKIITLAASPMDERNKTAAGLPRLSINKNVLNPGRCRGSIFLAAQMFRYIRSNDRVLEIGTGTAVQAIQAAQLGAGFVLACDINLESVRLAKKNVERHRLNNSIRVIQSDGFSNISVDEHGRFDVIVSHLPWHSHQEPKNPIGYAFFDKDYALLKKVLIKGPDYLRNRESRIVLCILEKQLEVIEQFKNAGKLFVNSKISLKEAAPDRCRGNIQDTPIIVELIISFAAASPLYDNEKGAVPGYIKQKEWAEVLARIGKFNEAIVILSNELKGFGLNEINYNKEEMLNSLRRIRPCERRKIIGLLYALAEVQLYAKNYKEVVILGETILDLGKYNCISLDLQFMPKVIGLVAKGFNGLRFKEKAFILSKEAIRMICEDVNFYQNRNLLELYFSLNVFIVLWRLQYLGDYPKCSQLINDLLLDISRWQKYVFSKLTFSPQRDSFAKILNKYQGILKSMLENADQRYFIMDLSPKDGAISLIRASLFTFKRYADKIKFIGVNEIILDNKNLHLFVGINLKLNPGSYIANLLVTDKTSLIPYYLRDVGFQCGDEGEISLFAAQDFYIRPEDNLKLIIKENKLGKENIYESQFIKVSAASRPRETLSSPIILNSDNQCQAEVVFCLTVQNEKGISEYTIASTNFICITSKYRSCYMEISKRNNDNKCNYIKKKTDEPLGIKDLLELNAVKGDTLEFKIEGDVADKLANAIKQLKENGKPVFAKASSSLSNRKAPDPFYKGNFSPLHEDKQRIFSLTDLSPPRINYKFISIFFILAYLSLPFITSSRNLCQSIVYAAENDNLADSVDNNDPFNSWISRLNDTTSSDDTRKRAIAALVERNNPRAIKYLIELLNKKENQAIFPDVVNALVEFKDPTAVVTLPLMLYSS